MIRGIANRDAGYRRVVNSGMFALCDGSFVPLYVRWICGLRYNQYCGSQIFRDIVASRRYRMAFLGTSQKTLDGLRDSLRA